jgi:hypothetical protein
MSLCRLKANSDHTICMENTAIARAGTEALKVASPTQEDLNRLISVSREGGAQFLSIISSGLGTLKCDAISAPFGGSQRDTD